MDSVDASRVTAANRIARLALIASALVIIGWFVPYVSLQGNTSALSEDNGGMQISVLLPALAAGVAASIGLRAQRGAATLAAGAAATVASLCLVTASVFFDFVRQVDGFFDADLHIGFFLHVAGGIFALAAVIKAMVYVRGGATQNDPKVNLGLARLGACALTASGIGFLLPDDGVSIFDIDSRIVQVTFVGFACVVAISGIVGFMSGRTSGVALAIGAAITPICIWLADAVEGDDSGGSFFSGFGEGSTALVAGGGVAGALLGVIALAQASPAATSPSFAAAPLHTPESIGDPAPAAWTTYPDLALDHEDDAGFGVTAHREAPGTHSPPTAPPAGWYPDPYDSTRQRYWDGGTWTPHVTDGTEATTDPR